MNRDTQNTALLIMDMQAGILGRLPESPAALLSNAAAAIAHARRRQLPVIYVKLGFRPGAPEISTDNESFAAMKAAVANVDMDEFTRTPPQLAPQPDDIIVLKRRVSAFTGSDLEVILRSVGARHLVLTGIATSGVVLSTLREAADKDYTLTVLADACADRDEEVHRVLTTKVFTRQAHVTTVADWCAQ